MDGWYCLFVCVSCVCEMLMGVCVKMCTYKHINHIIYVYIYFIKNRSPERRQRDGLRPQGHTLAGAEGRDGGGGGSVGGGWHLLCVVRFWVFM